MSSLIWLICCCLAAVAADEQLRRIVELDDKVDRLTLAVNSLNDKFTHLIEQQQEKWSSPPQARCRNLLAIGGAQYAVELWDVDTGEQVSSLYGHRACISAFEMVSESLLASASYDRTINVWDLSRHGECMRTMRGHTDDIYALELVDGKWLASGSRDHSIRLWLWSSGACVRTLSGHKDAVSALARVSAGRLASASADKSIRLWAVESGECLRTLLGHEDGVWSLVLAGYHVLASGSADHTVKLWNLDEDEGDELVRTIHAHAQPVSTLALVDSSTGERLLASGGRDSSVLLWSMETGECVRNLSSHYMGMYGVEALGATSGRLATGSIDNHVKIWRVEDGQCVRTLNVNVSSYNVNGFKFLNATWCH